MVQRTTDGTTWTTSARSTRRSTAQHPPGAQPHRSGDVRPERGGTSTGSWRENTVGYGAEFPSHDGQVGVGPLAIGTAPAAPTALTATLQAGLRVNLTWTDNAVNEAGFVIQRSTNGGRVHPDRHRAGSQRHRQRDLRRHDRRAGHDLHLPGRGDQRDRTCRHFATATVIVPALPAAPTILTAKSAASGGGERMTVTWGAVPGATGYTIQWSATAAFTTIAGSGTVGNATTHTPPGNSPGRPGTSE